MFIRPATTSDRTAIWQVLAPVVAAGETNALPRDMTRDDLLSSWMSAARENFVAEEAGDVLGTSYIQANHPGGGSHVANAGYMVAEAARGRGVGRRLCLHSIDHARAHGFQAMQFNLVVSSNIAAIHLWQSLDFEIAGRLPGAFNHPRLGYIDAFVMFRSL